MPAKASPKPKSRVGLSFRRKTKKEPVEDTVRARRWRLFVEELNAYKQLMQACSGVHV